MYRSVEVPTTKGYPVILHYGCVSEQATIKRLVSLLNKSTGEVVKSKPRCLTGNQSAVVEVTVTRPVPLELYRTSRELGRYRILVIGFLILFLLFEVHAAVRRPHDSGGDGHRDHRLRYVARGFTYRQTRSVFSCRLFFKQIPTALTTITQHYFSPSAQQSVLYVLHYFRLSSARLSGWRRPTVRCPALLCLAGSVWKSKSRCSSSPSSPSRRSSLSPPGSSQSSGAPTSSFYFNSKDIV